MTPRSSAFASAYLRSAESAPSTSFFPARATARKYHVFRKSGFFATAAASASSAFSYCFWSSRAQPTHQVSAATSAGSAFGCAESFASAASTVARKRSLPSARWTWTRSTAEGFATTAAAYAALASSHFSRQTNAWPSWSSARASFSVAAASAGFA
jgi:hypothetical protein